MFSGKFFVILDLYRQKKETTCPADRRVEQPLVNKEERLARQLQRGDKAALREFYALHASRLTAVCARYVTDDEDLKDVVQDTLVNILTHVSQFRYQGEGSLSAWTTRIAVNQSLKHLRELKRHELTRLDHDLPDENEDDAPSISDIPPDILHRMIRELPTGYRTVLNLYVFEGWTHSEIASQLGIKKDTSASQLRKAKNLLTKKLKAYQQSKSKPQ